MKNTTFSVQHYGIPEDILRRKSFGDFQGAIRLIDRQLSDPATPQALRGPLEVQKLICQLLPQEFPYSREDALGLIRQNIPDFTDEEFDELADSRRIRWIYVNGEMRYFNRFFSSLQKALPGFAQRAGRGLSGMESAGTGTAGSSRLDMNMKKMKECGSASTGIRIRATVQMKEEFFTPGMFLRVHLPVAAACDQQRDIRIERMVPESGIVSPEDAAQRTVCWEGCFQENQEFLVEYSYLHTARYKDAYRAEGICGGPQQDLQEQAPHIVFSPFIRDLCKELSQGLTTPLEKARAFYDFITLNMKYTFMPSYIVLEDIAQTCAQTFTGDCGVFALLFITLCRCAGIPAQWQSGLTAEPDFIGGHDWVRFYAEPFGWIFADLSYGISAVRVGNEERRQFYFGNLDPYRMVANREFYQDFTIPKQHLRADPYDNQLGEIETLERGFQFDDYIRSKEILLCQEI